MGESHIEKEQSLDIIEEELWIEKIARITRCEQLGQKIFHRKGLGPYLFQWFFQIINMVIVEIIALSECGQSFWSYGAMALVLTFFGVTFAVWAIKRYKDKYYKTINALKEKNVISETYRYAPIIPDRAKLIILFLGFSAILLRIIYVDVIPTIQNPEIIGNPNLATLNAFSNGLVRGTIAILIWVFIYVPLVSEFVALFFGIQISLPLIIRRTGLNFRFSDPHLFSGLSPIGNLFKQSAAIYFIGLTIYLMSTIGAQYRFGVASTAFFVGGWILGFVLFFAPQLTIHSQMKQAKQKKLEELEERIRGDGDDDGGFLFPRELKDGKNALKYIYDYLEYNHADKLKVFPFDMTTIRDLMMVAIIPISAEVIIKLYFHFTGL